MKKEKNGIKEIRYICKVCKKPFYIPEKTYRLMAERGESLPERCELHRKEHREEIRNADICLPYFEIKMEDNNVLTFDYYNSLYTFHGRRPVTREERQAEINIDNFKITDEHIIELFQKLENYQAIILISPTGTGKSIFIPFRLIFSPEEYSHFSQSLIRQGQLIQTQPLSSATERIPEAKRKLAGVSKVGPLSIFGLRHRGKEEYDKKNIEITVTDGSLKNWIRDGLLAQYSLVMIDEAHKRTLNIDNILMLLIRELPKNPHLRVIISSATINFRDFKEALEKGGVSTEIFDLSDKIKTKKNYFVHFWGDGKVEGCDCWLCKSAKEEERFWKTEAPPSEESELPEIISRLVIEILKKTKKGSILAFLPGEALIKKTVKLIESRKKEFDPMNEIPVLGIYSRLGEKEVERLFNFQGRNRRVLVTTDIAETSHTLGDIVYVIDSGYQKEKEWDPETETTKLTIKRHSQAGCKQRWGRVGRIQRGYVYCIYTKDQFENDFKKYTEPEIFRNPMNDTLLTLKAAGIRDGPFLIGKPQDKEKEKQVREEIKRASKEIKTQQQIDEKGVITEDALEIFHTPLPPDEVNFLKVADEMNCLLEATLTLFLSSTEEKEPRTGTELYNRNYGLLIWNEYWKASTKEKVYRIHQALKVGCQDDLDFITKLAFLVKRNGREWAKRHFVDENVIETISKAQEFINEKYRQKVREKKIRDINWEAVDKVRLISFLNFPERIVNIDENNRVNFGKEKNKKGIISKHCNGTWQPNDKAVCLSLSEEEVILNGKKQLLPSASFLIKPYKKGKISKDYLFVDQEFPVESVVSVKEENGKTYIDKLIRKPPPLRVSYNKPVDPLELENIGKEEILEFRDEWIMRAPKSKEIKFEGIWEGENKSEKAKIVGWIENDGKPVALLTPDEEKNFIKLNKKLDKEVEIKIEKIVRYPNKMGWIRGRTTNGLSIPIEISEMCLDPKGPGLEMIEGETVTLTINEFNKEGLPQLSNINRIIKDLENIKKEILERGKATKESKRKSIDLLGYIVDIEEKNAIVVIKGENGILHPFEIAVDYVPGKNLDNLRIGWKVAIRLIVRNDKDKIDLHYLSREEIENIPKNWKKDKKTNKLLVPFCLKKIKNWPARSEIIDFVKRHSWRYFLNARLKHIKDAYDSLKFGDKVKGRIIGQARRKDGHISGIKVKIEIETPQGKASLVGFVPKSKLKNNIYSYDEGKEIDLVVIDVFFDPSNPKLVLREE